MEQAIASVFAKTSTIQLISSTLSLFIKVLLVVGCIHSISIVQAQGQPISTSDIEAQLNDITSSSKKAEWQVKEIIKTATGDDLVRAQLKLVSIYRKSGQQAKSEQLLNELVTALPTYHDELKIKVLISAAFFERRKNNYAKAADIIVNQALPIALPEAIELGRLYQLAGVFLRLQMKLKEAKEYYLIALEIFQQNEDYNSEAQIFSQLGVLYESEGDLVLAAEYQIKAMRYFERTNDIEELAGNYFNLGELYYRAHDYTKSLSFYLKALDYDKQLNSIQDMGFDYHRIGSIYLETNDFDKAIDYTDKAIAIFTSESANQLLSRSHLQMAKIYNKLNDNIQRFKHLTIAVDTAQLAPTDHQLRQVWHDLGAYYLENFDYPRAKQYLEKSLVISNKLGLLDHQLSDNELLSNIHHELGEYDDAHQHLESAFKIKLQLHSEQRIREIEKHKRDIDLLEEQIKVAKLQEENKAVEAEAEVHKTISQGVIFIALVLLFLFTVLIYFFYQRRKLAILKANLYQDALNQKNQILADVSHELRTPLTALKLQVDALKYQLVDDVDLSYQKLGTKIDDLNHLISDIYELALSDVNGLSFEASQVDFVPILMNWGEEFEHYASAKGFEWHLAINANTALVNIDTDRIKQVLSNLLTNSIKYTDAPGQISLSLAVNSNNLILVLKDSSPGVPDEELEKIFERLYRVEKSRNRRTGGSGLGLSISQNIIEAHEGTIFASKSDLGGLAVTIRIPLCQQ
ncbi:Signal transduction histidine-protein kinase BaeS [Shewanella sp. P1-14-1]|uniref:tetratricopeptide repeat protein n=1 Tax=Shewanella sp. P1-14-1 TaxID=1723761 RepID=UPI0006D6830A|nr:tetratricopeptide repeat protein [Shewanella sp. P1-14-1]KPZ73465.1 Signal transduction histidine-protein kinase BaeS [Shewanella sp. P1-14-1]